MSATPTAALVEEAEKLSQRATPGPWRVGTVHAAEEVWAAYPDGLAGLASERLLLRLNPNFTSEQDTAFIARARTLVPEFAAALRRAEAELDAATTQLAKKFKRLEELEKQAQQAEAERDAQHAEVLRLTAERDALVFHNAEIEEAMLRAADQRDELTATRDLLLTENAQLQQMLSRPDPVVHETPVDGVVPCCGQKLHDLKDGSRVNEGPLVNCDRMRLLSRVGELSSTNLILIAENARLHERVATLELLRRGGK